MATAKGNHPECPVCHDNFQDPKILLCGHLVCRKCVVSWVEKGGDKAGCPLCRAPILPAEGVGDLASQVDALPTDLATAAVVESEKALSGSHVCSCCEDAEGVMFCLQCAIKLCGTCSKIHAKIPSSQNHVTQALSDLSAEQLASHRPSPCSNHGDKQAELYCTSHEELMCVLCASSTHRKCPDVAGIGDMGKVKREELRAYVKKLEEKEAAVTAKINQLDAQMSDGQAKFKAMKDEVKATFDSLQTSLETRRQKLNSDIQQREDTFLAEGKSGKLDLENLQAALSANKSTAERLVSSAPDGSLLGMMGKLKSRLDAMESQVLPEDLQMMPWTLSIDSDRVAKTQKAVAAIGELIDSKTPRKGNRADQCLWCGWIPPTEGPAFAAIIRVGDRVRRGRDWSWGSQDGSPPGPVIDISPTPLIPISPTWPRTGSTCSDPSASSPWEIFMLSCREATNRRRHCTAAESLW